MTSELVCPICGSVAGRGATHCMRCGSRLDGTVTITENARKTITEGTPATPTLDKTEALMADFLSEGPPKKRKESIEEDATLPPIDDTELEEIEVPSSPPVPLPEKGSEKLEWDEGAVTKPAEPRTDILTIPEETKLSDAVVMTEVKPPSSADVRAGSQPIVWDDLEERVVDSSEVKEGNPYIEIEPPKVIGDTAVAATVEVGSRALVDEVDDSSKEAVEHLFPSGRGTTSGDFIDAVVGKPKKIGARALLSEAEKPACPSCGAVITDDSYQYPPYVFEAMGRARLEAGMQLLKDAEHEKAIDYFEKAKMLAEKSDNAKLVEEATRRVDEGYESMATAHYDQGEKHLKAQEYEWAIVQFKKARELYMLTTDAKMRAKCMERAREVFSIWGKAIEDEGDAAVKRGQSRDALMMYQQAAEKYRSADDTKRLKGLERKIRKA